jgi:hypothetical protein
MEFGVFVSVCQMVCRSNYFIEALGEVKALAKTRSTGILVSLGAAPLLVGILGARAIATAMQEMGAASEELFRGDRLPVLKITSPDVGNADQQD